MPSAGSQTVLPTVRFSPATTVEFIAAANTQRSAALNQTFTDAAAKAFVATMIV